MVTRALALPSLEGGPGHRGEQEQRTLEPLGWGLRPCAPAPHPQGGPDNALCHLQSVPEKSPACLLRSGL